MASQVNSRSTLNYALLSILNARLGVVFHGFTPSQFSCFCIEYNLPMKGLTSDFPPCASFRAICVRYRNVGALFFGNVNSPTKCDRVTPVTWRNLCFSITCRSRTINEVPAMQGVAVTLLTEDRERIPIL